MSTSAALDVAAIKAEFPILGRTVHGAPLVYLDSAATSQKPAAVLDAVDAYYRETNANVHRGVYELAAVHVGVRLAVVGLHGVEHRGGLLRGGGRVEVDERRAVDGPPEDREVRLDRRDVDRG